MNRGSKPNGRELYDLVTDSGESKDLAFRYPEKMTDMLKQLNNLCR
jgi:hypothetical protein